MITDPPEILHHFQSFFSTLASSNSDSTHLSAASSNVPLLEDLSYGNDEQILDTEICAEDIESALRTLKLGKSSGPDGVSPEHTKYGGVSLKVWLKKVFNRILLLEEVPASMKEGLVIPVYKGQGKDPLLVNSYRGITLSSVLAKLLEIVLLQRLSPVLEDLGVPDSLQTAYQKGISCMDAIYATQEALIDAPKGWWPPLPLPV